MNKVWIVTRECYPECIISAIFSTKEKAWEYYNMKSTIDYEYNEPKEWNVDKEKPDEYVKAYKYNDDNEWRFCEWEDYMEECITENMVIIKVSFNPDKDIMRKSANDRSAFLKAQQMEIV